MSKMLVMFVHFLLSVVQAIHPDAVTSDYIAAGLKLIGEDESESRRLVAPMDVDMDYIRLGSRLIDPNDDPLVCPENITINRCDANAILNRVGAKCRQKFNASYLTELCDLAKIATDYTNSLRLEEVVGEDSSFIEAFYDGGTGWNEYTQLDNGRHNLSQDAIAIDIAYERIAQSQHIAWPFQHQFHDGAPTVKHSDDPKPATPPDCDINAVVCCYPRDRQADNNGNCREPYESRCTNADPVDNTDLCAVPDFGVAPWSGHIDGGSAEFPGSIEGRIHCHGLAWDPTDAASAEYRFAGNVRCRWYTLLVRLRLRRRSCSTSPCTTTSTSGATWRM